LPAHSPTVALVLTTHEVARLHRDAGAGRWGLNLALWHAALERSLAHADVADADAIEKYLRGLHLKDLALAAACIEGLEPAWEHFVSHYRPALLRAADAIDPTGAAQELADALYGELYGLADSGGVRKSLLRYFHGRSSLGTWLRTVLAQRHVDRLRARRRIVPLPDEPAVEATPQPAETASERTGFVALMRRAVGRAVAGLAPRDRLRLSCYYAQNLRLNQIGRALGEHEATVSRHLARTRQAIRQDVERQLAEDAGLDPPTIAQCFEAVVADADTLDLQEWLGDRKSAVAGRSKD
jgi:RNA polymerase sigma factor (sigma-70 family)